MKNAVEQGALVSFICPVHNEEAAIPIFLKRLRESIAHLRNQYDFELIFVDDGSTDSTIELIKEECDRDEMVQLNGAGQQWDYFKEGLHSL